MRIPAQKRNIGQMSDGLGLVGGSMEPRSRPNDADTAIRTRIRMLDRLAAAPAAQRKGKAVYRSGLGNLEDCRLSAGLPDVHALRSMVQDNPGRIYKH